MQPCSTNAPVLLRSDAAALPLPEVQQQVVLAYKERYIQESDKECMHAARGIDTHTAELQSQSVHCLTAVLVSLHVLVFCASAGLPLWLMPAHHGCSLHTSAERALHMVLQKTDSSKHLRQYS